MKAFENSARVAHQSPLTGLAELVHNASDAQATRLDILVRSSAKPDAPAQDVLVFRDNGTGMNTEALVAMLEMGTDNPNRGDGDVTSRYGVGFKNGVMKNAHGPLFSLAPKARTSCTSASFHLTARSMRTCQRFLCSR